MSNGRHHDDDHHMTLKGHIKELGARLLVVIILLLVTSSLVYVYRSSIIPILLEPVTAALGEQKLMYLNPAGGFNFIFLVSIYIGVAAVMPFIIQQLYAYIRPTLPKAAQKLSLRIVLGSGALLITGILFGYFIAVPGALTFLNEFAGEYVTAALTADSYLNFLIAYTVGLGLLFQLPIFLIVFNYIKPLTPSGLIKSERWAIVLIFIAAAIITPTPDPVNLMIVAVPILVIYQIGVVSVLVVNAKKRRMARRQDRIQAAQPAPKPAVFQQHPAPTAVRPNHVVTLKKENSKPARRVMDGVVSARHAPQIRQAVILRPVAAPTLTRHATVATHSRHPKRYMDGVSVVMQP